MQRKLSSKMPLNLKRTIFFRSLRSRFPVPVTNSCRERRKIFPKKQRKLSLKMHLNLKQIISFARFARDFLSPSLSAAGKGEKYFVLLLRKPTQNFRNEKSKSSSRGFPSFTGSRKNTKKLRQTSIKTLLNFTYEKTKFFAHFGGNFLLSELPYKETSFNNSTWILFHLNVFMAIPNQRKGRQPHVHGGAERCFRTGRCKLYIRPCMLTQINCLSA